MHRIPHVCVHACSLGVCVLVCMCMWCVHVYVVCACAGAVCMHGVYMCCVHACMSCMHVCERAWMHICLHAHTSIFLPHQFTFLAACSACSWYLDFLPGKVRINSSSPSSSSCVVLHCSACQQFTQPIHKHASTRTHTFHMR